MKWVNTSPLVRTYTFEEFCELPEPPNYSKVELIGGILYLTPRPTLPHSNIVSRLVRLLTKHCRSSQDKGVVYVPRAGIRGENTWLEPDFFYVSVETELLLKGDYHTTADLAVEVITNESAIYDRNTKADTYAALDVKELWLVDELEGLIEVRVLKGGSYESHVFEREDRLISTVLSGFSFRVGDVFGG